jgi:hypothetical protein
MTEKSKTTRQENEEIKKDLDKLTPSISPFVEQAIEEEEKSQDAKKIEKLFDTD